MWFHLCKTEYCREHLHFSYFGKIPLSFKSKYTTINLTVFLQLIGYYL